MFATAHTIRCCKGLCIDCRFCMFSLVLFVVFYSFALHFMQVHSRSVYLYVDMGNDIIISDQYCKTWQNKKNDEACMVLLTHYCI